MTHELDAFLARRNELRRQRRFHTPLEMPGEYRLLTGHIRQSIAGCGRGQGLILAQSFGSLFGWDPADLLRGAAQAE